MQHRAVHKKKIHLEMVGLGMLIGILSIPLKVTGASYIGPDNGEFTTGANWDDGIVPTSGNSQITNKDVISNGDVTSSGRLLIGWGGNNGGSLTIQSGTLTFGGNDFTNANYIGVDSTGNASLTLNGGNFVSTTGALWLAGNAGTGSAELNVYSGSSLLLQDPDLGRFVLGAGGSGSHTATANFYGGTISIGNTLRGGHSNNNISNINLYSGVSFSTAFTQFGLDSGGMVNLNFYVEADSWIVANFGNLSIGTGSINLILTLNGEISDYWVGQEIEIWKTNSGDFSQATRTLDIQVIGLEGILDEYTGKFLVTAIPEPSTYSFVITGIIAFFVFGRRKLRQA